jgi:hypothetical protein
VCLNTSTILPVAYVKKLVDFSCPTTRHGGACGRRGGIAPTHSRPRHYMGVSGQRHAPCRSLSPGKGLPVPIVQEAGWAPGPVWKQEARGKILSPLLGIEPRSQVVQPVASHYKVCSYTSQNSDLWVSDLCRPAIAAWQHRGARLGCGRTAVSLTVVSHGI